MLWKNNVQKNVIAKNLICQWLRFTIQPQIFAEVPNHQNSRNAGWYLGWHYQGIFGVSVGTLPPSSGTSERPSSWNHFPQELQSQPYGIPGALCSICGHATTTNCIYLYIHWILAYICGAQGLTLALCSEFAHAGSGDHVKLGLEPRWVICKAKSLPATAIALAPHSKFLNSVIPVGTQQFKMPI